MNEIELGNPEIEAMAETIPTKIVTLTGSTGVNPTIDSTLRAGVVALPAAILAFLHVEYGFLSTEGFASLEAAVAPVGIILWGLFDRFIKPRIMSS